jgi:hypothetical protein
MTRPTIPPLMMNTPGRKNIGGSSRHITVPVAIKPNPIRIDVIALCDDAALIKIDSDSDLVPDI